METAAVAPPAAAPARPALPVPASIVPLRGLPIVGVVIAALIAAIASNKPWALNFFHVAGGGAWTALDLFLGLILGPVIRSLAPPARAEFTARYMPKMLLIMPTLVTMTLGSGFQLARHFDFLNTAYPRHGYIVASMIVVGVMAVIALGVLQPAGVAVLFELRKSQPNVELIGRLMKRYMYSAGVTGLLQVATLVIMTRLPT
jgi:hypothetical protein